MYEKRILIAEDNEDLALLQAELLKQRFAGCTVRTASTGAQTKGFLQLEPPDILVLDLTIPPPDGLSLLRWMQTALKHRPYVVVTTGCTEQRIQQQALQLGASYYLLKPYAMNDFLDTVGILLEESMHQQSVPNEQRKQRYMNCVQKMLGQMTSRIESEGFRFILLSAENYFDFGRSGISMKALSQKMGYTQHSAGESNPAETAMYRLIREIEQESSSAYRALCGQFGVKADARPTVRRFLSMLCEAALQQINLE